MVRIDVIKLLAKVLNPISKRGIHTAQGWYDGSIDKTHITFCIIGDRINNISDDEEEEIIHHIQVDLWSKSDEWMLKKEIKKLMIKNDFGYVDGKDFYENDTKIYHKAMRFKYIEVVKDE